ncbi:hypothetical protein AB5J72_43770 [Streptomyces sp. CG1]|uniref:oxidoreductase n=1 Tax=Streptomyces sp. CG1 TaxID=1287523 RepID=UPI0034E1B1BD
MQLWKDETEPWLRRLADEVHEQGAAVMTQLTHLGHRAGSYADNWLTAISASTVREPAHRTFAKGVEQWDLDRVRQDFVDLAQRCRSAGLDGIELVARGHGTPGAQAPDARGQRRGSVPAVPHRGCGGRPERPCRDAGRRPPLPRGLNPHARKTGRCTVSERL